MPITFKVSEVEPDPREDDAEKDDNEFPGYHGYRLFPANVLVGVKCGDVEPDGYRLNLPVEKLLYDPLSSGFMSAVHIAYDGHLPLTLSPDDLWCVIVRGLAIHINENAEKLRHLFVSHEGKKSLILEVLFGKGDPSIDWEAVLAKFRDMLECAQGREPRRRTQQTASHDQQATSGGQRATATGVSPMLALGLHRRLGSGSSRACGPLTSANLC